jgi:4-amino-4-deoxy-L-arabinose transferase-like glycosyltransferase
VRHPLFYVPVIAGGFFPWSLLLPLALRSRALRGPAADAGLWAAVVVGFFSLGQGKLATYVLPAFPALALLVAALACEDGPARASAARRARFVRVAAAVWAFVLIALPGGILVYTRSFYPALAGATLLALPLPLLAWLGVARLRVERFATLPACIVFAAVNVVLLTTFYGRAAPVVSAVASDASIAEVVRRTPDAIPVIAFRVQPASLSWYGGRAVRRVGDVAELRDAARRGPLLIVTRRRHEQALRDAGLPLHEWLDTRRHLLYATVPVS